jgi:predicted RNA-binding protein with PUA-like domain
MSRWLLKTEPGTYSYADLERDGGTSWGGVRNYTARNNLRAMKAGELCLIYHSMGPKEIVGIATVARAAYPDPSADDPAWVAVDVKAKEKLAKPVTLAEIKAQPRLQQMLLVKQSRLSVCPVSDDEWKLILSMAR